MIGRHVLHQSFAVFLLLRMLEGFAHDIGPSKQALIYTTCCISPIKEPCVIMMEKTQHCISPIKEPCVIMMEKTQHCISPIKEPCVIMMEKTQHAVCHQSRNRV